MSLAGGIWKEFRTQFTFTEFKYECQICVVRIKLASTEHQEMNEQVKVTWRTLRTIARSLMVHAQFLEAYIHFTFMYTADHILPVLPIKYLINEYGEPTTTFKLFTDTKPSIPHLHVYFFRVLYEKLLQILGKRR